jgi:tetratricopeptide (TPR) repeat protein
VSLSSKMTRIGWAVFLVGLTVIPAQAEQKIWLEARSPHFRVLSDGTEAEARSVARQFEKIRVAFATALPTLHLDSPAPLLILALRNESSAKALLPDLWKRQEVKPGGFFASGSERSFAVVRLDVIRRQSASQGDGYQVVYHEYTHALLNANFRWIPLWLNEGLAEFFGNTQFDGDKIYLGAPNIRAQYTRGQQLVPIDKLISLNTTSPEYQDPSKVQMFYSESWGLAHLLLVPADMGRGLRLQEFLTRLEKGSDQAQAFQETIGSFRDVEDQLRRYLDLEAVDSFIFKNSEVQDSLITVGQLSTVDANSELGTFQVWVHENAGARETLQEALKKDSRSALALEGMGFLSFSEGKDQEAARYFERALQADQKRFLSLYYKAVLSRDSADVFQSAMKRVIDLKGDFAPAYIQLAQSYLRQGNVGSAMPLALKAQQLWPSKAGYHIFIGYLLHRLGRDTEAAAVARYVEERWQGISHDEAVDLWQQLPAQVKRGSDLMKTPQPSAVREWHGRIQSLTCNEKDQTMAVMVDGIRTIFRMKQDNIRYQAADTIWYGPDHFSACRHLDGLRAVIRFRPASASANSSDLLELDVYDDYGL